jgi:hypothetical protein
MGASAEVIHEPEHRIPTYYSHGSKLLPIHRGIAAHVPFRGGSNGQGQELPVPIHRRAGQVDQNGKAVQTQHLLQQAVIFRYFCFTNYTTIFTFCRNVLLYIK